MKLTESEKEIPDVSSLAAKTPPTQWTWKEGYRP